MTSVLDLSQASSLDLSKIPDPWPLVPVVGKRPCKKNWVNKECDRSEILAELQSGKATGLGLKLGNGLLAVDIDGESAAKLLFKLSGQNTLPVTTAWTSGRPGRTQYLLSVEEKHSPRLRNLRIGTGVAGDDGKEECLEFRWLGTQSVLPPSIHPLTNKPYTWINNPLQTPPALAPEWLVDLCESWHSEYAGIDEIDLVRFPARLFPYFRRQMSVWLLARRFDIARWKNAGKPRGVGIGKFTLTAASVILRRTPGHVRKLLRAAKKSGIIRTYKQKGDWVTVYYTSLERAIAIAGLDKVGPIAAINIDSLSNLHLIATEVECQNLQRSSFHLQRREEIAQIKPGESSGLYTPMQLMTPTLEPPSDHLARVLGRSQRFIFCESGFKFYGGSQEAIAQSRGLSAETVSRHLSNSYRLKASPVRGFRRDLPPIIKKQLVEHLPGLKNMPPKICLEEGLFLMGGEWWKPHCNVYLLDHRLVSARRRRAYIQSAIDKESLCSKTTETPISVDKFCLSILPIEENNSSLPEIKSGLPEFKKWGKTYYFDSVPNWNTGELNVKPRRWIMEAKNQDKEKQK
jgi:hypothetical protein